MFDKLKQTVAKQILTARVGGFTHFGHLDGIQTQAFN